MPFSVELTGVPETISMLGRIQPTLMRAAGNGIGQAQQRIFAESQREVPELTGELRASGEMQSPAELAGDMVASITYGRSGARRYAAINHWSIRIQHPHGGGAFFLTNPSYRGAAHMRAVVDSMVVDAARTV